MLSGCGKISTIYLAVLAQYRSLADRLTDGRTDGRNCYYNYNYNYKVSLFSKLFSEESCSVVGLSEQMSFQLGSELLATDVR